MPIDLVVEERFHRAAPGGMGGTKAAGNYSPVLLTQRAAKVGPLCSSVSVFVLPHAPRPASSQGGAPLLSRVFTCGLSGVRQGGKSGVVGCSGRGRLRCPGMLSQAPDASCSKPLWLSRL